MGVHRLEAVIGAEAVGPLRERGVLVPGQDRLPLAADRLEVAAVLPVVGVLFQPVEGIPRHLEGEVVVGDLVDLAGGVEDERRPVDVLLVAQLGIDLPIGSRIQWNPPNSPVAHDLIEVFDALAGVAARIRPGGAASRRRRRPPSRSSAPGRPGTGSRRAAGTSRGRSSGGSRRVRGPASGDTNDLSIQHAGGHRSARGAGGRPQCGAVRRQPVRVAGRRAGRARRPGEVVWNSCGGDPMTGDRWKCEQCPVEARRRMSRSSVRGTRRS